MAEVNMPVPSNSNRSKAEEPTKIKRVDKVVVGKASVKKSSIIDKFVGNFLLGDAESIKSYIVNDILVPRMRDIFNDAWASAGDILFNGSSAGSRTRRRDGRRNYGAYYTSWRDDRRDRDRDDENDISMRRNYRSISYETRADAMRVLDVLRDAIDQYKQVSIDDVYDASGITSDNPSYRDYGWKDLVDAEVVRVNGEYKIDFPKPVRINN
jgi:hypothetical protein